MTIAQLEARKIELQNQQAQLIANTHAISGAIQDCDFWIGQLKKQEPAPSESSS